MCQTTGSQSSADLRTTFCSFDFCGVVLSIRLPSFGKVQQSRGNTAGFRLALSLIVLGKVSRWCLYSEWGKLRPSAETTFLSHRSLGDLRAGGFLTVLCLPLQTPAALQISLWGLRALFPNLMVDKLLVEEHFLTGFYIKESFGC